MPRGMLATTTIGHRVVKATNVHGAEGTHAMKVVAGEELGMQFEKHGTKEGGEQATSRASNGVLRP